MVKFFSSFFMNMRVISVFGFILLYLSTACLGGEFFVTSEHYFVCFTATMALYWCYIRLFSSEGKIHISTIDIAVCILIIYLTLNCLLVSKFPVDYLSFCALCSGMIAYMVAKQQFDLPRMVQMIIFLVLLSGITQCIWGILQCIDIVPIHAGIYRIVGSFQNPGVYANYLACIFPLALAMLLYSKKQPKRILSVISLVFIVCCFIMPFTMARAAWLGMFVGSLVITEYRYGWLSKIIFRMKKFLLIFGIVAILIFICGVGVVLYHLKPESAQGRLLIYKIALGMCKEHPLMGTGFNTFAREYNMYQADYFASGAGSETEKWLANINQVAFNEYLQIAVETGLVGLVLLLTIVVMLIYNRKQVHTPYAIGSMGSLASLACCACFSYPFHEISIVILVGLMLLIAGSELKTLSIHVSGKLYKKIIICLLSIAVFLCYYSVNNISLVSRWKNLATQTSIYGFDNKREQYKLLSTKLNNDPYFLYNYGVELSIAKEYKQGISILQYVCHYLSNTEIFCYLGDNYKGLGQYEKAEAYYQLASNTVPNKFYPLYCLAKLYHETGDSTKAFNMASIIVNKKEKVRSYTTYKIKNEMKQMADSLLSIIHSISPISH